MMIRCDRPTKQQEQHDVMGAARAGMVFLRVLLHARQGQAWRAKACVVWHATQGTVTAPAWVRRQGRRVLEPSPPTSIPIPIPSHQARPQPSSGRRCRDVPAPHGVTALAQKTTRSAVKALRSPSRPSAPQPKSRHPRPAPGGAPPPHPQGTSWLWHYMRSHEMALANRIE